MRADTFFYLFFCILFFNKKSRFQWKWSPKWTPKGILLGAVFRKNEKIRKCVSTAQARTDCMWALVLERPRILKITPKNKWIPWTVFFYQKSENWQKMTPKGRPKGWLYILLTSLGRPLGHHWCPKPFLNIERNQNAPNVPMGVANYSKKWPGGD